MFQPRANDFSPPFNRNWISPVIRGKLYPTRVYSFQIILNNDTQNFSPIELPPLISVISIPLNSSLSLSKFCLISQQNRKHYQPSVYMINFLPRSRKGRKAWKIGAVDHGGIGMWGKWPCCGCFVGLNKQP